MSSPSHETTAVRVGNLVVGGGAPVVIQSMTNTDTADVEATARQCVELVRAGSEMVRVTVNTPGAAKAVVEIKKRMVDKGCDVPLIGDFHYNGHLLLTKIPRCATALDKYRINPGNVGIGARCDEQFTTICEVARDNNKAVRIGVNAGSLNPELVERKMKENADREPAEATGAVLGKCMVLSALESTELALKAGLSSGNIILSCKSSRPLELIALYRDLSSKTSQPLHLGLTEAGMGLKGLVWSTAPMAVLLNEGIGDTIRVSLTPNPGGDRSEEVYACRELLQALDLRRFSPTVTSCPGCGRTTGTTFQRLTKHVEAFIARRLPEWSDRRSGVETMSLAVMGCIVNGPGESKAADIGISLPGTGESPRCPVFVKGRPFTILQGDYEELARGFEKIVEEFVVDNYPSK